MGITEVCGQMGLNMKEKLIGGADNGMTEMVLLFLCYTYVWLVSF